MPAHLNYTNAVSTLSACIYDTKAFTAFMHSNPLLEFEQVDNITSSQSIDEVDLIVSGVLGVDNIAQTQLSDNINMIQNYVLVVDDTTQQQSLGNIFFEEIPDLGDYIVTFRPDDIGMSYAIDDIQIKFVE